MLTWSKFVPQIVGISFSFFFAVRNRSPCILLIDLLGRSPCRTHGTTEVTSPLALLFWGRWLEEFWTYDPKTDFEKTDSATRSRTREKKQIETKKNDENTTMFFVKDAGRLSLTQKQIWSKPKVQPYERQNKKKTNRLKQKNQREIRRFLGERRQAGRHSDRSRKKKAKKMLVPSYRANNSNCFSSENQFLGEI